MIPAAKWLRGGRLRPESKVLDLTVQHRPGQRGCCVQKHP